MDSNEIATGTPFRALLPAEFSTHLKAERALSECASRAYVGNVDLLLGHSSRSGRTAQHAHPRA
ncbi:hypothetical protein [Cellulomonas sp. Root485]|jgi:hypothetical protein|uniref:hypothetical protein n=1 Tax=Cellulomonas sp. Root485 TaxID=1736546 RepID=UPI0012FBA1EF|nr:hypothetical protein [Cellulomonas sp. Root485]